MSTSLPDLMKLQSERDQLLFEIKQLERDIEKISDQLADSEQYEDPDRQVGGDWWYRARDAKRHKERERKTFIARAGRLGRTLARYPDEHNQQGKAVIKDVLRTLLHVARAAARFHGDESEENSDRLAFTLDHLDKHVPGWDQPREIEERPVMQKLRLVD